MRALKYLNNDNFFLTNKTLKVTNLQFIIPLAHFKLMTPKNLRYAFEEAILNILKFCLT